MKKLATLFLIMFVVLAAGSQVHAIPTETIHTDFFWLGDLHVYDYASHMDLDRTWIGSSDRYLDELSWTHTLPSGFSVPPYEITRARLWIDGAYIGSDNNEVAIGGLFEWDPLNHHFFDNSSFNLANIDEEGFWNNGGIDVSVFSGENSLRLDNAILMFDYDPVAAPEPATLALFGLGLTGLGIIRKRTRK